MTKKRIRCMVDAEGFVYVDGVKVARRIDRNGEICLQFLDKCKRRSSARGERMAEIPASDFDAVVLSGPLTGDFTY